MADDDLKLSDYWIVVSPAGELVVGSLAINPDDARDKVSLDRVSGCCWWDDMVAAGYSIRRIRIVPA